MSRGHILEMETGLSHVLVFIAVVTNKAKPNELK
jgi:hypothetical protein